MVCPGFLLGLAGLAFIERKENVVLLGPSGVAKHTWPALWLIGQSWQASPPDSFRFIPVADLTLQLVAAHHQGRLAQYFSRVVQRSKLLVIDEIGYLPFGRSSDVWVASAFVGS